jgi:transposase
MLVTHTDQHIIFEKGDLKHASRRVELWSDNKKKSEVLLTNNFELSVEDIEEIYKRRWAIETLYKQLKQNFPLHFFYGDSVNAIEVQTWVVLIANLLCTIIQRKLKRHCSFSNLVTMAGLMLMYYVDFIAFLEKPEKDWEHILQKANYDPPNVDPILEFDFE